MCGIVGYIGSKDPVEVLIEGLRRLEYRGYDSAGIAVVDGDGALHIRRAPGKLRDLEKVLVERPIQGRYGIAHTRWATHGRPTEENAHPHRDCTGKIVVIHNGIIENYLELKHALQKQGHRFVTETDTEIVAHALEQQMKDDGCDLVAAFRAVLPRFRGIYALVAISTDAPDTLVAARVGPPLVVGIGKDEYFVASDIPAILSHTKDVVFMDDYEIVVVKPSGVNFMRMDGSPLVKEPTRIPWDPIMAEKGGYKHFMLKEIHEQPRAVRDTLLGRVSLEALSIHLEEIVLSDDDLRHANRMQIIACGTSWHAGHVGKFLIERLAKIPVEVDYASEYRYRKPMLDDRCLSVFISQSGETADTLAAERESRSQGAKALAICNVRGSMLTRECDGTIYTHAGPEIGVASTKAFTSQVTVLALLTMHLGRLRDMSQETGRAMAAELEQIPGKIERILAAAPAIHEIAAQLLHHNNFLYLGRGVNFPVALEGALKLKEISYIHAEGYPAAEMKHGPIALIDEHMPVVFVCTRDSAYEKVMTNMQEVRARHGKILAIATEGDAEVHRLADFVIPVPATLDAFTPLLSVIPLQLLAYSMAVLRGCDVDMPRNLAKSVTVE